MGYRDVSLSKLKAFEGQILFLYRDSADAGNATIATGQMIPNAIAALAVPFKTPLGFTATPDQIRAEYARVMAMPRAMEAKRYYAPEGLIVTQAWSDWKLSQQQSECEGDLSRLFHGYDALPDTVKIVLIDMVFNLGFGGFQKYHQLIASIHAGDFVAAAGESYRNGLNADRNKWAHDQLEAAGSGGAA